MRWILTKGRARIMIIANLFQSEKLSDLGKQLTGSVLFALLKRSGIKFLTSRVKTGLVLGEYATLRFRNCGVLGKR